MAKQISLARNWCSELVAVVNFTRQGAAKSVPGNLEEIGERSALVLTEYALTVRSKVLIACRDHLLRGVITSCEFHRELGYFVEIEFAAASRWSRGWFSPEHLVLRHEFQLRLSA